MKARILTVATFAVLLLAMSAGFQLTHGTARYVFSFFMGFFFIALISGAVKLIKEV